MMLTVWLTYVEAAEWAGVSVRTIREWVSSGELVPVSSRFRARDVVECAQRAR